MHHLLSGNSFFTTQVSSPGLSYSLLAYSKRPTIITIIVNIYNNKTAMRLLQPKAALRPNEERLRHPQKRTAKHKTTKRTTKTRKSCKK